MDKFFIKNEMGSEVEQFLSELKEFAARELFEIIKDSSNETIIYPIAENSLVVGRFSVSKQAGVWRVCNYYNEILHEFTAKSSAVYFTIATIKNRFKLADKLRSLDMELQSANAEYILYERRTRAAMESKDEFKMHLYICKMEEAKGKVKRASGELVKTLKTAKYLNKSGI